MPSSAVNLDLLDGMNSRRVDLPHLPSELPLTPPRSPCETPPKQSSQQTAKVGAPAALMSPQGGLVSTYVASRRLKRKLRAAAASGLRDGVAEVFGQTVASHLLAAGADQSSQKQPMALARLELDFLANSLASGIASRLEKHLASSFVNNTSNNNSNIVTDIHGGSSFRASTSAVRSPTMRHSRSPGCMARQAASSLQLLTAGNGSGNIGEF